jgi:hypothetical protein
MELNNLVGKHYLMGVDFENTNVGYNDAQQINFVLDGKTYSATEDPEDGYRSCMKMILECQTAVKNLFYPVEVVGSMDEKGEIIEFRSVKSGQIILRVGTDCSDNYYPWFVAQFTPENIPTIKEEIIICRKANGRMLRPIEI